MASYFGVWLRDARRHGPVNEAVPQSELKQSP